MMHRRGTRRKHSKSKNNAEDYVLYILICMGVSWVVGFLVLLLWYFQQSSTATNTIHHYDSNNKQHPLDPTEQHYQQQQQQNMEQNTEQPPNNGSISTTTTTTSTKITNHDSPLLIFTCHRANYLKETLEDVFKYIPRPCQFGCPVVVSQDGSNAEVQKVIAHYKSKFESIGVPLVHYQHDQQQEQQPGMRGSRNKIDAYKALAQHYGWALKKVFNGEFHSHHDTNASSSTTTMLLPPQRVIILEEDIHIASDFFEYFQATAPILDNDSTLFAVSSFNDNGHMVKDPTRVLRSDFFPGLGWMMTRTLWDNELQNKWPNGYWDDWLREPKQRQNRQVIRPEVSRTFHFGVSGGASSNQFGNILSKIQLNHEPIHWLSHDLSHLHHDAYIEWYDEQLQNAKLTTSLKQALKDVSSTNVQLEYTTFKEFQNYAREIHIMDDEKATIPRTAFYGIVETRPFGDYILFLTPTITELSKHFPSFQQDNEV